MKNVEIYTTPICGFCMAAKRLLKTKNVNFVEYDVWQDPSKKAEMVQRANGRGTVPQIFIGGAHVGGSDELHALERENRLDTMLAS